MKFAIGDIVVEKKQARAHTSYSAQKVVGYLDGALLLEHHGFGIGEEIRPDNFDDDPGKPGSRMWREGITRHSEDELFTPEELLVEVRRLETAEDQLSQEFDAVRDQVKANLKQAADLVNKAAALVVQHDRSFEDLVEETEPLYKALKKGGWSHSTLQCKMG